MELTIQEKLFLYEKLAYGKKIKTFESNNALLALFNDESKLIFSEEEKKMIADSLEHSFKRNLCDSKFTMVTIMNDIRSKFGAEFLTACILEDEEKRKNRHN